LALSSRALPTNLRSASTARRTCASSSGEALGGSSIAAAAAAIFARRGPGARRMVLSMEEAAFDASSAPGLKWVRSLRAAPPLAARPAA
jgi:hypothetical protein